LSPRSWGPIIFGASKATRAECWKRPNGCWPASLFFPPEKEAPWEKGHHRLERRRIARAAVSPEEIGLCGCWQVLAIERRVTDLKDQSDHLEIGYYATSAHQQQFSDEQLLQIVRDHWAAIENGSHLRRDVTFREDECRVSKRGAAQVLATLRNLALGLFELERERGRAQTKQFKSWCRKTTASAALKLLSAR